MNLNVPSPRGRKERDDLCNGPKVPFNAFVAESALIYALSSRHDMTAILEVSEWLKENKGLLSMELIGRLMWLLDAHLKPKVYKNFTDLQGELVAEYEAKLANGEEDWLKESLWPSVSDFKETLLERVDSAIVKIEKPHF